jgi:hypothetical protein
MWAASVALTNASLAAVRCGYVPHPTQEIKNCLSEDDIFGDASSYHKGLKSLARQWTMEKFWVPSHVARGFPAIFCKSASVGLELLEVLHKRGVAANVCYTVADIQKWLFRTVTVCVFELFPGVRHVYGLTEDVLDLVEWLAEPYSLGTAHSDAYVKHTMHPLGVTEDVWGVLGAYVWDELEGMLTGGSMQRKDVDGVVYDELCRALDSGEVGPALQAFDKLGERQLKHKRRHYFDICTLYIRVSGVWAARGQGDLFRRTAKVILHRGLVCGVNYERLYLTCFWLWTGPYWQNLCKTFLQYDLFAYDVDEYRAICKEITARVTSSWFWPGTNKQHIASSYWLNAEDLTGFADNQESSGAVAVEVLEFALSEFEYTFPGGEDRDFASYLTAFAQAAKSLLRPIYEKFATNAKTFEDVLQTRAAWAASGVSGRRARDVLGREKAPPGSSKAYVMSQVPARDFEFDWGETRCEVANKMDERGPPRCLTATDMQDQVREQYVARHLKNRYANVGLDIGESPTQAMTRHAQLVGASRGQAGYMADGHLLTAWDWQKWDHYYHAAEKLLVLRAMRELSEEFMPDNLKREMVEQLDALYEHHETLVYRAQSFADDYYGKKVDDLIAKYPERIKRLDGEEGRVSVLVKNPNGQQSGRYSTLESNTIVGTSRLIVRDAELMGKSPHLGHRVALYRLNRADDVAEVHSTYKRGVAAVEMMLRQGHRANPKKQVSQWRSIVYLRILYAGGSMRAFPARAVYAAASGHPEKGQGAEISFMDKLKSISKGLDMWVRRGGFMAMAQALYSDAEEYFRKTRVWTKRRGAPTATRVVVPVEVIRAAPENKGLGILPPGSYSYDYSIKCSDKRKFVGISDGWKRELDRHVARSVGPGIHDLERSAADWVKRDCDLVLDSVARRRFILKWSGSRAHQDGTGDSAVYLRNAAVARANRTWHRDKFDKPELVSVGAREVSWGVGVLQRSFDLAHLYPGTDEIFELMKTLRGLPAAGMIEHLWHGYGSVLLGEAKAKGSHVWSSVLHTLASVTSLGREFLTLTNHWPTHAKADHLAGKLGAAGAWDKIIPPSWAGWVSDVVGVAIWMEMKRHDDSLSRYRLLKIRAEITRDVSLTFVQTFPNLCIH